MQSVLVDVRSTAFSPVYQTANATTTTITVPVVTITAPQPSDGIVVVGSGGSTAPAGVQLIPYGAGSALQTFGMAVYGWRHTTGRSAVIAWIPYLLAQFVCTLCTATGVDTSDVPSTQRFCDTIQLQVGNLNVSCEIVAPSANQIAHVIVTTKGNRFLSVLFGTGGSATSANALAASL